MRVLALCADSGIPLDSTKGATIHLLALWRALARAGADVIGVAPIRGPGPISPNEADLEIRPVRDGRRGSDILALDIEACARDAADGLAPDVVLERLSLTSDLGVRIAKRLGVPLVVEVNAPIEDEARQFRGAESGALSPETHRNLLVAADLVYCVSESLVPYVLARGARRERVFVLPNGVDVASFARPPEPSIRGVPEVSSGCAGAAVSRPLLFGFVGSFKAWHGCDLLLDALARVRGTRRDVDLALVGDGPTRPALETLAEKLGIEAHVRFLGARPHQEIPGFLHSLDVAVAPAPAEIEYYFSPLKVYEYAAAGCAMIAPRAGQVNRRFEHGRDAWLVTPGSVTELAEAMLRLSADARARQALGMAAAARARAEFDWSVVAHRLLGWLGRLRDARGTARKPDRPRAASPGRPG